MAIIYSYPTVVPTKTDLILGTDVSTTNKSTKFRACNYFTFLAVYRGPQLMPFLLLQFLAYVLKSENFLCL